MSLIIEVESLVKRYGKTVALRGLNLRVGPGEVHGFLGPNGAGKTTTIRTLLGLLRHDSGDVRVFGRDPHRDAMDIHARLAYVPGDVNLWPALTGGEVIDVLTGLRGGVDRVRRRELIERFELDPHRKCSTYSKGNRQKVALVAAFAADVELLVLDEPTSGLDPLMERRFTDAGRRRRRGARRALHAPLRHRGDRWGAPMTGIATALKLGMRLNHRGLAAAILAVIACMYAGARGIGALYPTARERTAYASIAADLTSQKALQGPGVGLTTTGGIAVFEVGWYLTIAVALINIVVVIRNTRAQEAAGRLELLRAGRFGVHANSVSVMVLAAGADVLLGLGVAAALAAAGAGGSGAIAFGVATAAIGIVFAALALVAGQVTEHARGAYGIACGALAVAYVVRAWGDVADAEVMRLVSPLGAAQAVHPFGQTRWWPVLVCAGVAVAALAGALLLERMRDYDAGLLRPSTGAATAGRFTRTIPGLIIRNARATTAIWAASAAGLGIGFGAAARDVGEVAAGTQGMLNLLAGFNVNVLDGFLAMSVLLLTVAAGGAVIAHVSALRTEELAGRADLLLSGTVRKWRLAATHITISVTIGGALLVAVGAGLGVSHGLRSSDPGQVVRLLVASLAQLPAVVFFAGVTMAVVGLVPRLGWLPWVVLAGSAVVSVLGPSMKLSATVMNSSVFDHVPRLPGVPVDIVAPLTVLAVGVVLAVAGVVGFARRDLD